MTTNRQIPPADDLCTSVRRTHTSHAFLADSERASVAHTDADWPLAFADSGLTHRCTLATVALRVWGLLSLSGYGRTAVADPATLAAWAGSQTWKRASSVGPLVTVRLHVEDQGGKDAQATRRTSVTGGVRGAVQQPSAHPWGFSLETPRVHFTAHSQQAMSHLRLCLSRAHASGGDPGISVQRWLRDKLSPGFMWAIAVSASLRLASFQDNSLG